MQLSAAIAHGMVALIMVILYILCLLRQGNASPFVKTFDEAFTYQ